DKRSLLFVGYGADDGDVCELAGRLLEALRVHPFRPARDDEPYVLPLRKQLRDLEEPHRVLPLFDGPEERDELRVCRQPELGPDRVLFPQRCYVFVVDSAWKEEELLV